MQKNEISNNVNAYRQYLWAAGGIIPDNSEAITHLIHKGILLELYTDGSQECIDLLLEIIRRHPSEQIRNNAHHLLEWLAAENNQNAQESLCNLYLFDQDESAREITQRNAYLPANSIWQAAYYLLVGQLPDLRKIDENFSLLTSAFQQADTSLQDRLLRSANENKLSDWAFVVDSIVRPDSQKLDKLIQELPVIPNESIRQMALELLDQKASQGETDFRERIIDLWIYRGFAPARDLALKNEYLPDDAPRRALFYFLTDQWDAYQSLDFDQRYLSTIYAQTDAALRRRITSQARRIGRVDWMQTISRGRRVRWLGEMNDTDWFSVINTLVNSKKWPELWRLAQVAPPIWSVPILLKLQNSGWSPESDLENNAYAQMTEKAVACSGVPIEVHSPRTLFESPVEITCLAISPGGTQLAAGTNQGTIYIWRFPDPGHPFQMSTSPGPIWSLCYSPDGHILASGHGDHSIRVWDAHTNRSLKVLEGHDAMVRSLRITPDNRTAVSASFDGTVRTWRFPLGPAQKTFTGHHSEIFSLAISPDGRYAASGGADHVLRMWYLQHTQSALEFPGHTDTITSLEFDPSCETLISGSRDCSIRFWSVPEGYPVATLSGHDFLITNLCIHPNGKLLASADFNGQINLWSFPEGTMLQSLPKQPSAISGLVISPDGYTLINAARDGRIQLWDLRPLIWIRMPVDRVTSEDLQILNEIQKDKRLSRAELTWFEFTHAQIKWRRQFDIELEEIHHPIQVGEYDIEIIESSD